MPARLPWREISTPKPVAARGARPKDRNAQLGAWDGRSARKACARRRSGARRAVGRRDCRPCPPWRPVRSSACGRACASACGRPVRSSACGRVGVCAWAAGALVCVWARFDFCQEASVTPTSPRKFPLGPPRACGRAVWAQEARNQRGGEMCESNAGRNQRGATMRAPYTGRPLPPVEVLSEWSRNPPRNQRGATMRATNARGARRRRAIRTTSAFDFTKTQPLSRAGTVLTRT